MATGGAWGSSPPAVAVPLQDIMSEETARHLQCKQDKKFARELLQAQDPAAHLLLQLQEAGTTECQSDAVIAQMLQVQFDQEYSDLIKVNEMKRNGLYKYKIVPEHSLNEPEDETAEREREDWDGFQNNEKDFAEIPKCGYKIRDGKMITKHDKEITSRRNASKVMDFPPEFQTGDGGAFDMRLNNKVFNSLKAHSRSEQSKKNKFSNRKESHATAELGVDEATRLLLYKFVNNEMLNEIDGIISTGKEAVILHAFCNVTYPDKLLPAECAIKVFKTTLNEFKTRDKYIKDDYRFKDRFCKLNPRKVIHLWAEKEMHNLMRIQKIGIHCPEVISLKKHILIMSFIGEDNKPAPKLKDAVLTDAQWIVVYEEIVEAMHKLYNEGQLIHADLSEYNILWHNEHYYFIDVSQAVEPTHPRALEFLLRDCNNISKFFSRKSVPDVKSSEDLFESITGIQGNDLATLERLRYKGPSANKNYQDCDEKPEESKTFTYPFDYAWEKSEGSNNSHGVFVHHDGIRDDFAELWNKTVEKKNKTDE